MKKILILVLALITLKTTAQDTIVTPSIFTKIAEMNLDLKTVEWKPILKDITKFATVYGALRLFCYFRY